MDSSCQLYVFWHYHDPFSVDGTEICLQRVLRDKPQLPPEVPLLLLMLADNLVNVQI